MSLLLIGALLGCSAAVAQPDGFRVGFGSCAKQTKAQPIWSAIVADKPDVFVLMGDNIYSDTEDPSVMAAAYAMFGQKPGFRELKQQGKIVATWDDHDYGANDGGASYPMREASEKLFLDFFDVPASSPRRSRPGIYDVVRFEDEGRVLQIILLDTRSFRSDLLSWPEDEATVRRESRNMGPYRPTTEGTMLGEAQWAWLEKTLAEPADLRILVSSIQVIGRDNGWEAWTNMPHEHARLYQALAKANVVGQTLIISGDKHHGEVSREVVGGVPLLDVTSSGLTQVWEAPGPNEFRHSRMVKEVNYGMVEVDWSAHKAVISLRTVAGESVVRQEMGF